MAFREGSRVEEAALRLEAMIRELPEGARLPSVRRLMESLKVSQVTLNGALSSLESRGFLDRRRGSGLYARKLSGPLACLLVNPLMVLRYGTSPFYPLLITALQHEASRRGIRLQLHFIQWVEEGEDDSPSEDAFELGLRKSLLSGIYQGAFTVGLFQSQAGYLKRAGVPTAAFGGVGTWQVSLDPRGLLVQSLAWLKQGGVQRVEWWGADPNLMEFALEAAEAEGLILEPVYSEEPQNLQAWAGPPQAALGFDQGMKRLASCCPEAILISDDAYAQGILMAMTRLGLQPSRDVKVSTLSIAGSPTLWGWQDKLHCYTVEPALLAQAMADCLALEMGMTDHLPPPPDRVALVRGVVH